MGMNPHRTPQADQDRVDASVLAVYERRRNKLLFGFSSVVTGLIFVAAGRTAPAGEQIAVLLFGAVVLLSGAGILWFARQRRLVAAIGEHGVMFKGAGLLGFAYIRRCGSRKAVFDLSGRPEGTDQIHLSLTEDEFAEVGKASAWYKNPISWNKRPDGPHVTWLVVDSILPTPREFTEKLNEWIDESRSNGRHKQRFSSSDKEPA